MRQLAGDTADTTSSRALDHLLIDAAIPDNDRPDDTDTSGSPTADTTATIALGLSALFRRRPTPTLHMPGGRIALHDYTDNERSVAIRYL